jgi:hypothetical protein
MNTFYIIAVFSPCSPVDCEYLLWRHVPVVHPKNSNRMFTNSIEISRNRRTFYASKVRNTADLNVNRNSIRLSVACSTSIRTFANRVLGVRYQFVTAWIRAVAARNILLHEFCQDFGHPPARLKINLRTACEKSSPAIRSTCCTPTRYPTVSTHPPTHPLIRVQGLENLPSRRHWTRD